MTDNIPTNLGKYEVVEEIDRGSMGTVYLGHDPYIDRPVAIKVAHAEQLNDADSGEQYRKMFFNEAHTAGDLPTRISSEFTTPVSMARIVISSWNTSKADGR